MEFEEIGRHYVGEQQEMPSGNRASNSSDSHDIKDSKGGSLKEGGSGSLRDLQMAQ